MLDALRSSLDGPLRWVGLRGRRRLLEAGERARRAHSLWLSRAMLDPRLIPPRIPTKPVDRGGFDDARRSEPGRAWCKGWWADAFEDAQRRESAVDHRRR